MALENQSQSVFYFGEPSGQGSNENLTYFHKSTIDGSLLMLASFDSNE